MIKDAKFYCIPGLEPGPFQELDLHKRSFVVALVC